jgi:hypothetical protein
MPGNEYPVFDTDFGRIGTMICWDISYPEVARELAARGAEVILMPIAGGKRNARPGPGYREPDLSGGERLRFPDRHLRSCRSAPGLDAKGPRRHCSGSGFERPASLVLVGRLALSDLARGAARANCFETRF